MTFKPVNRWLAPTSLLLLGALPIAKGVMSQSFTPQGLAAGAPVNPETVTRVLITPYMIAFGFPEGSVLGFMLAACWVFDLSVADWIIRRPAKAIHAAAASQPSSMFWAVP